MGNTPSTSARPPNQASSASSSPSTSTHESPSPRTSTTTTPSRRDPRNLIQAQRAPTEPSLAQARGTPAHRTRPSQSQAAPSQSSSSPSSHSDPRMGAQQSKDESKPATSDLPSKPVDVPIAASTAEPSASRSYSQSIDPSGPPTTQDMSYHLTRPPRLPLPIEEEVHTPGSPIIAPTDIEAPLLDIEALDNETVLPRRSSALSNTTIDEEDAEELRIDKDKASVPTVFEWKSGGDKVYVTGTIFQWNKKYRLHPV